MKAATERKVIRWLHLLASIPILGFIYGPVANIPRAAFAVRFILMPLVLLSGLWLWKGHVIRKWLNQSLHHK
jgi:thiosulfate reductase cytochrome b subunit